jgi:hypothetical protein
MHGQARLAPAGRMADWRLNTTKSGSCFGSLNLERDLQITKSGADPAISEIGTLGSFQYHR